jgi:16S rRNA (cytosine967-C5)-methyltransferase
VQDAAAALVARLAGDVRGKTVADLCAAPGGKTAMLAAAGAKVTAVDVSAQRLERLRANLGRLRLDAEVVEADVSSWAPGRTFDVVLLDAPCTATGTIRRHPDILRLKGPEDVARMAQTQARMLAHAATLVASGGPSSTPRARSSPRKASSRRPRSWRRIPPRAPARRRRRDRRGAGGSAPTATCAR